MVGQRSTVLAANGCSSPRSRMRVGSRGREPGQPVTLEHGLRNLIRHRAPPYHAFVIAPTGEDVLVVGSRTDRAKDRSPPIATTRRATSSPKLAPPPFSPAAESMSGVWTGKELAAAASLCPTPTCRATTSHIARRFARRHAR